MGASKTRPVNPDPEKWIVVQSKDGFFLRRKRGTVTKAVINDAFRAQAENNCSAETKEIFRALAPFIAKLFGRKQVYVAAKLRKAKVECGIPDYRYLEGHEINAEYELIDIYKEYVKVKEQNGTIHFHLPVREDSMNKNNEAVSHYYFEAILISGDPQKPGTLRSENDMSKLYSYAELYNTGCELSLVLRPGVPYLAILKVGCIEYGVAAHHPKHYAVKIMKAGGWKETGSKKKGAQ